MHHKGESCNIITLEIVVYITLANVLKYSEVHFCDLEVNEGGMPLYVSVYLQGSLQKDIIIHRYVLYLSVKYIT